MYKYLRESVKGGLFVLFFLTQPECVRRGSSEGRFVGDSYALFCSWWGLYPVPRRVLRKFRVGGDDMCVLQTRRQFWVKVPCWIYSKNWSPSVTVIDFSLKCLKNVSAFLGFSKYASEKNGGSCVLLWDVQGTQLWGQATMTLPLRWQV